MSKTEQIRACHAAHPDWTAAQIGEHLGFTSKAVASLSWRVNIKLPRAAHGGKPSEPITQRIVAQYIAGIGISEIAANMRFTRTNIFTRLRDVPPRGSAAYRAFFLEYWMNGGKVGSP